VVSLEKPAVVGGEDRKANVRQDLLLLRDTETAGHRGDVRRGRVAAKERQVAADAERQPGGRSCADRGREHEEPSSRLDLVRPLELRPPLMPEIGDVGRRPWPHRRRLVGVILILRGRPGGGAREGGQERANAYI